MKVSCQIENPKLQTQVLKLQAAIKYGEEDLSGAQGLVEQVCVLHGTLLYWTVDAGPYRTELYCILSSIVLYCIALEAIIQSLK